MSIIEKLVAAGHQLLKEWGELHTGEVYAMAAGVICMHDVPDNTFYFLYSTDLYRLRWNEGETKAHPIIHTPVEDYGKEWHFHTAYNSPRNLHEATGVAQDCLMNNDGSPVEWYYTPQLLS